MKNFENIMILFGVIVFRALVIFIPVALVVGVVSLPLGFFGMNWLIASAMISLMISIIDFVGFFDKMKLFFSEL